jgi:hypothetical protein
MKPWLLCLNLNGMDIDGEAKGRKILPLGVGTEDVKVLRIDPRQRLQRSDRHPQSHQRRRRRPPARQPRRLEVARAAAR